MFRVATLIVSLIVASAPARAQQPKIDEFKMVTYQAVFVTKGPRWMPETPAALPVIQAHREYVAGLLRSGRAHIGGPLRRASLARDRRVRLASAGPGSVVELQAPPRDTPADDAHLRGVYIVSGTPEQAKELAEADPGVKDGRYAAEILQWMGPEGWFQKPADVTLTETIYFGFLVTGPNTAPVTADEQKALMQGHLGYMDGQAKLGKLVLAGPLIKAGPRRGLIAYRVPTEAEAIERANADPMIKAGRMTAELYEWTVPRGILK